MSDYKVCPQCEEEYTLTAEVCGDCGAPLVLPDQIQVADEPDDFPEVAELVCVRIGPLAWTRALSDTLSEAGIEHRVEPDDRSEEEGGIGRDRFGGETVYGTWVRPEDRSGASDIDQGLFAHFEPEAAGETAGDEVCPACGERLSAEALSCPGCGLSFG